MKLCVECEIRPLGKRRFKYCDECSLVVGQRKREQWQRNKNAGKIKTRSKLCAECGMPHNKTRSARFCADCAKARAIEQRKMGLKTWRTNNKANMEAYNKGRKVVRQERKWRSPDGMCEHCEALPKGFYKKKYCDACSIVMDGYLTANGALVKRVRSRIRKILRAFVKKGRIPEGEIFDHLGYTPVELVNHLAEDWPDGFPEDIENYHIDHIIPINHYKEQGKLESMEDIMECFALENLRLIPAKENLSKGFKVIR